MKKQELIKIIELVVRKEVKKQMNEIFIKDNDSSSLSELVSTPTTQPKQVQKPKKEVQYTSNEALNRVLNETVGGVPQGESSGYPTMGGGIYDSSKINDILVKESGYGNPESVKEKKREIAAVDTIKRAGVNVEQVPDHVQNALTKDYSKVMKAIDQKKNGGYRP